MQLGIKYYLVTTTKTVYFNVDLSDNTTLFRGNHNRLDLVEGLDFPGLRTSIHPRAGIDGDLLSPTFRGARYVTMGGMFAGASPTQIDTQEGDLRAALNEAVRADAVLNWVRRDGTTRRLTCRLWEPPQVGLQGWQRHFRFMLAAADPYVYAFSQTTHTDTSVTTASTVTNGGDADSYPVVRVYGNATTPTTAFNIRNDTNGGDMFLQGLPSTDLDTAGEYIEIDMALRTIKHSSGASRIDKMNVSSSVFWRLQPGANSILVNLITGGNPDKFEVIYRDAWIGG
jgi:hypothetical protein